MLNTEKSHVDIEGKLESYRSVQSENIHTYVQVLGNRLLCCEKNGEKDRNPKYLFIFAISILLVPITTQDPAMLINFEELKYFLRLNEITRVKCEVKVIWIRWCADFFVLWSNEQDTYYVCAQHYSRVLKNAWIMRLILITCWQNNSKTVMNS